MSEELSTNIPKEDDKDNFTKWFLEFKKGWNVRIVENDHLLRICFLEFLSTINKVRYVYGGQYKSVNLSSFKIQQSGTGKGVADGYVHDALRYLGYKVCKMNNFTEAGMVGTCSMIKDKVFINKGALGEYDFIWIDEGKNLINGNNWTEGLLEVMNGYLDDGRIFKRMAKGEVKYFSNCNFGVGTFFFGKLKPAVLSTGFFQRLLFSYKNYTRDDILRISGKYSRLANKNYLTDLEPVFRQLKEMRDKLDFQKYNIGSVERPNYVIRMDEEASIQFGDLVDEYYKTYIFTQVGDERLQDILSSFVIRYKDMGSKLMCLYAVWNEYDTINTKCVDFAFNMIKELLEYILNFVSDTFESKKFDTDDLNKEEIKNKKISVTNKVILDTIKKNPGMTKSEFRDYVRENRKLFPVGELKIVQEFIPKLEITERILSKTGKYNRTEMFINPNSYN